MLATSACSNSYRGTVSMTIYLYVKTHNKTGLKYLGKTKSSDPHLYQGSGSYWTNHIKKHGYDVTTEIIKECSSKEELKKWGSHYSKLWNVVRSKEWANLKEETGDGGDTSMCENFQTAILKVAEQKKKARWWNNGKDQLHCEIPPSDDYKPGRLKFNNIGAKLGAQVNKSKHWVNNGVVEMMVFKSERIPETFSKGRLNPFNGVNKTGHSKGFCWWNNGETETMSISPPDQSFVKGRLPKG